MKDQTNNGHLKEGAPTESFTGMERSSEAYSATGPANLSAPWFFSEFLSRNQDILTEEEQQVLQSTHIMVAGCGSVGGAVVEPLTRMGAGSFVLADPDVYEISNLNRQACYLNELGHPKAVVLAKRIRSINPFARVCVFPEGLTEDNLEKAMEGVSIVFDGIDPSQSPWVNYLVHKQASQRKIPVISGIDLGGQATLYVFDYRRHPRPFYGKTKEQAHRQGKFIRSMLWLDPLSFPADFIPIALERLAVGGSWPQTAYCVSGMGALGSRTVLDVAMGRRVRHIVSADMHMLPRKWPERMTQRMLFPVRLGRTCMRLLKKPEKHLPEAVIKEIPARLLPVFQAIGTAPSAGNAQPWQIIVTGKDRFRVAWDRDRAQKMGSNPGPKVALSLGCAIEAAQFVSHLTFEPNDAASFNALDWDAGEVRVARLHEDGYYHRSGLLSCRRTNRSSLLTDSIDPCFISLCEKVALEMQQDLVAVTDQKQIGHVQNAVTEASEMYFKRQASPEELVEWWFLLKSGDRVSQDRTGWMIPKMTGGIPPQIRKMLHGDSLLHTLGKQAGIPLLTAGRKRLNVRPCGALVFLASTDASVQGTIAAGRAMMRIWLEATRFNLAVQPLNNLMDLEAVSRELSAVFGKPGANPMVLLRIGKSLKRVKSPPKLPVSQFCQVNQFG